MGADAPAAEFKCLEPARYKNLLQVFDDNPDSLASYFALDGAQAPDLNACRALAVTGTIHDGDSEALLSVIIQNGGWLDLLYLSFDGIHFSEEIKLAHVIRDFRLKTRVVKGLPLQYEPDFATRWAPAASVNEPTDKPSQISPLNAGLEAFAKRSDLWLPIAQGRNICLESCAGAWIAGVHRVLLPAPPIDVRGPAAASEIVTARPRAALAASLDGGAFPRDFDPGRAKLVAPGAAPAIPTPVDRLLRDKCTAELVAGEAIEARIGGAADLLARGDFRGIRSTPPAMLNDLDSLRRAGVRLQECVARVFERERLASFRRLCGEKCDKSRLLAAFDRTAREFVETQISLATILGPAVGVGSGPAGSDDVGRVGSGPAGSDDVGREWHEEETGISATWRRRGTSSVFDATLSLRGGKEATATLEIGRAADKIAVIRTQADGRCIYQGVIADNGKTARGTFMCSWAPGAYAWSATIGE
jgi:hypothetical protein